LSYNTPQLDRHACLFPTTTGQGKALQRSVFRLNLSKGRYWDEAVADASITASYESGTASRAT
jgi:hypothetical protein